MTSVFDRIKLSTTRSSVFQRLSMATKEEENQCPKFTSTRTSAFKRLEYLHIEEISTFNICFLSTKDDKRST